jgi:hypothetical protein
LGVMSVHVVAVIDSICAVGSIAHQRTPAFEQTVKTQFVDF